MEISFPQRKWFLLFFFFFYFRFFGYIWCLLVVRSYFLPRTWTWEAPERPWFFYYPPSVKAWRTGKDSWEIVISFFVSRWLCSRPWWRRGLKFTSSFFKRMAHSALTTGLLNVWKQQFNFPFYWFSRGLQWEKLKRIKGHLAKWYKRLYKADSLQIGLYNSSQFFVTLWRGRAANDDKQFDYSIFC